MSIIMITIIIIVVLIASLKVITIVEKKDSNLPVSGMKLMVLGINITIFGGIIVLDISSGMAEVGYIIMIIGLIVAISGLAMD